MNWILNFTRIKYANLAIQLTKRCLVKPNNESRVLLQEITINVTPRLSSHICQLHDRTTELQGYRLVIVHSHL